MHPPHYFFALFGDPDTPDKDPVEAGLYRPDPRLAPFAPCPGDALLLYCNQGYAKYAGTAPGVGLVLFTDREAIRYRYLPLAQAVAKKHIEQAFGADDLARFRNRRSFRSWLFQIARESFVAAIGGQAIEWP